MLLPLLFFLLYINYGNEISSFLEVLEKSREMQVILLIDIALVGLLLYFRLKENVPSRHVLFQAGGGLLLIFTWITTFIFLWRSKL